MSRHNSEPVRATLIRKGRFLFVSVVAPADDAPQLSPQTTSANAVSASALPASPVREGAKMLVCGQWEELGETMFPRTHNCVIDAVVSEHVHALRKGVEYELKAALRHEREGHEYVTMGNHSKVHCIRLRSRCCHQYPWHVSTYYVSSLPSTLPLNVVGIKKSSSAALAWAARWRRCYPLTC